MFIATLTFAFAFAIFSHAAAHHLFGVPGTLGLSRYYSPAKERGNETQTTLGLVAGPLANLFLGYIFFHFYRQRPWTLWLMLSSSNLFFLTFSCTLNMMFPRKSRNDLKQASRAIGVPLFVLPCLMIALATPPLWAAVTQVPFSTYAKDRLLGLMLATLSAARLVLTLVDKLTGLRITLVRKEA